ncbi:MAG TPA: F0F1 ATP synthase subunit B [Candidatus Binataceae bacterium]|nr:F0F1 ATP synthase subunit B [Candidatus Binataceae bacterium]
MSFSWWTFALQAANFLVLVWLLQRFLFKPVKTIVARRKEEISRALSEVSAQKETVEQLKLETEHRKAQLESERQQLLDQARAQASAERQKVIDEAHGEAKKIRDQSLARLEQERTAASTELYQQSANLATNLAEHLLRESTDDSIEHQFLGRVTAYLDRMPPQERATLLAGSNPESLIVTTAHPLVAQQQTEWRAQLMKRLGTEVKIEFQDDTNLVAGTVLTFPHAILRFNWRDSLAAAMKELRRNEHPD